jgi:hypothetical protein
MPPVSSQFPTHRAYSVSRAPGYSGEGDFFVPTNLRFPTRTTSSRSSRDASRVTSSFPAGSRFVKRQRVVEMPSSNESYSPPTRLGVNLYLLFCLGFSIRERAVPRISSHKFSLHLNLWSSRTSPSSIVSQIPSKIRLFVV